jgi:hypothetical protein
MCSRYLGAVSLSAVALLAGCSDQEARNPAEPLPQFNHIGSPTCNLNFNSLLPYFDPPRKGAVQALVQEMATAYGADDRPLTLTKGFAILANIEAAVNEGESSDAATGSTFANRVLDCMFTSTELGVTLPIPFTEELTVDGLGAFGVRGGPGFDTSGAVVAHDGFSATAPPNGSTWSQSLSERVLIYGSRPNANTNSYEWHKVPDVAFTDPPGIVVALCAGTTVSLLQEDGTFVPYVDGDYMDGLCGDDLGVLEAKPGPGSWGVFSLASRLVNVLRPTPAHAAAIFSHGTTAGKTGYSLFTLGEVPNITLEFIKEPVDPVVNVVCCATGTVTVKAFKTGSPSTPLPGVTVTLITRPATNKGKNTGVSGNVATTDATGVATFTTLKFLKSGLYTAEATGKIDDPATQGIDRTPEFVTDISSPFTVGGK